MRPIGIDKIHPATPSARVIKDFLIQTGMKQTTLAAEMGINKLNVGHVLHGRMNIGVGTGEKLIKVAEKTSGVNAKKIKLEVAKLIEDSAQRIKNKGNKSPRPSRLNPVSDLGKAVKMLLQKSGLTQEQFTHATGFKVYHALHDNVTRLRRRAQVKLVELAATIPGYNISRLKRCLPNFKDPKKNGPFIQALEDLLAKSNLNETGLAQKLGITRAAINLWFGKGLMPRARVRQRLIEFARTVPNFDASTFENCPPSKLGRPPSVRSSLERTGKFASPCPGFDAGVFINRQSKQRAK